MGYVPLMVVVSILPHAEFGPNDHPEDAHHVRYEFEGGEFWGFWHPFEYAYLLTIIYGTTVKICLFRISVLTCWMKRQ